MIDQVGPGLHVKIPIADRIWKTEFRQRKNVEDLATSGPLDPSDFLQRFTGLHLDAVSPKDAAMRQA